MATKRTPKGKKSQHKSAKPASKPKAAKAKPKVASKAKPKAAAKAKPKAAKAKPKAAAKAKPKATAKAKPKAAKAIAKAKPKALPKAAAKAKPQAATAKPKAAPKGAPPKAPAKVAPPAKAAAPAPKPSQKGAAPAKAPPPAKASSAGVPAPKPSQKASQAGKAAPPSRPAIAPPRPSRPDAITLAPRSSPGSLVIAGRSFVSAKGATPKSSTIARGSAPPGAGVTLVRRPTDRPSVAPTPALPIPVRKVEAQPSTEQRFSRIEARIQAAGEEFAKQYYALFDRSWIYHDSAIEGVVYTQEELEAGLGGEPIVTDSSLQPAADHIRRHKEAIEYVRDFGLRKRLPVTVDIIKKIYLILHPSEGDLKTVKYRKDVPQHRLYFHEYAQPDKIAYKVRQIVDWLSEPETKRKGPLRIAARAHYDLLRVFPFQNDSGKVARLFMNLLLYRAGYPPAIVHATERQRYYDGLKGEPNTILRIVQESVENGLASVERMLDERDAKARGPLT